MFAINIFTNINMCVFYNTVQEYSAPKIYEVFTVIAIGALQYWRYLGVHVLWTENIAFSCSYIICLLYYL